MTDVFTKKKRSAIMSSIHGKGNRTTEWGLRARLMSAGISGWRVNATDVTGKPDFVFDESKVAVFIDGCFWHGCKKCRNIPASNRNFWLKKINRNRHRDKQVTRLLRKSGWKTVRFFEHSLRREPKKCVEAIRSLNK
ncbi:MAG: very short patch repair endonuclease [candidate division Zixibacteria bacterium]|nr:very short patch repair endonuclease [candidate division Zixibacteria bacterium]MCI0596420.1 very short patch repair endonuclease [candidate division Zixibacteria bacterium]